MTAERPMQARQPISSMRHPRRRGVNINHVMATIMICTGTMAGLVSMLLIFRPHPRASLVKVGFVSPQPWLSRCFTSSSFWQMVCMLRKTAGLPERQPGNQR